FQPFFIINPFNPPFILITHPPIDGPPFYLPSQHYHNPIKHLIHPPLHYLPFTHHQFILSPLSIGSFPALYYPTPLQPPPLILPKPFINLPTIPNNINLLPPNHFPTSLHVLTSNQRGI
uniref:accessory Sec system protein Asp2 n=1 Tax=Staphylococcus capitis TaxID=29388 RepID=UPI003709853D